MDSILQGAQLAPSRTRGLVGRVPQHLDGVQRTRLRRSGVTGPESLSTEDTVLADARACSTTSFMVGRLRLRSDCVTSRCLLPVSPRPARVPLRTVSRSTGRRSATTRRTPAAPRCGARSEGEGDRAIDVAECDRPDRLRGRRVEHVQGAELNGAIHSPAGRRNDPTSPLPLSSTAENLHSVDHEAGVRHRLETIL